MREFEVKGATDVTGFSLLGHAWEMAKASQVTIEIDAAAVPLINGALELAAGGLLTSGDKTNREYVGDNVEIGEAVGKGLERLLFDPQTAGGMLISIAAVQAEPLLVRLRAQYPQARVIGRVIERGAHALQVK